MRNMHALVLALSISSAANADFSYTQTRKATGGMMSSMAGANGPQTSKVSFKGQKMKTEEGNTAIIIDFDAQTITTVNNAQKTYTVKSLNEVAGGAAGSDAKVDVKETGQKKVVNGFNASELMMTMEVDSPQSRQMGKMQMEIDMWLSPEVPGAQELHTFYQRNASKFPWAAMAGKGNPSMASAIAEIQKKLASMNGVQVEQVIKVKAPGGMPGGAPAGPSAAQMQQMQAGMEKARAQLEALKARGGPAAAMAEQQLARMGAASGPAGGGSGSGNLIEMTIDSSDFSTASIPDSAFAVPAGYQKN